jgi:molybdopterin molybdotransferase
MMPMKDFFKVTTLEEVIRQKRAFRLVETEALELMDAHQRVAADDMRADDELPAFRRATMDGYAVPAAATFGASESNPAFLNVHHSVTMGCAPDFSVGTGEAARIATGGMLPSGSDAVVMIEHTAEIDETTVEVYRSVAPGQHVLAVGEDFHRDALLVAKGQRLRAQETGILAAFGCGRITVYKRPVVGIVSTGDEVVAIEEKPGPGRIRDINSYSLSSLVASSGAMPLPFGIARDDARGLRNTCLEALAASDMVLISGGSSVGMRDLTMEVLSGLRDAHIRVHGISISPGKPTILAEVQGKPVWGLPGQVTSAMVVFLAVVQPFLDHIGGLAGSRRLCLVRARLSRNIASAQGRNDFVRVRLRDGEGMPWAEPLLGKSGLLNTMVNAEGLVEIDANVEGLDQGAEVSVRLL